MTSNGYLVREQRGVVSTDAWWWEGPEIQSSRYKIQLMSSEIERLKKQVEHLHKEYFKSSQYSNEAYFKNQQLHKDIQQLHKDNEQLHEDNKQLQDEAVANKRHYDKVFKLQREKMEKYTNASLTLRDCLLEIHKKYSDEELRQDIEKTLNRVKTILGFNLRGGEN